MSLDNETLEEFQIVMSWLNANARMNIASMFVTLAVFQALMSWLNVGTK